MRMFFLCVFKQYSQVCNSDQNSGREAFLEQCDNNKKDAAQKFIIDYMNILLHNFNCNINSMNCVRIWCKLKCELCKPGNKYNQSRDACDLPCSLHKRYVVSLIRVCM